MDIELSEIKLLLSLIPDWAKIVPSGLDPTFYGTLTYSGDLDIKHRVDAIQARVE